MVSAASENPALAAALRWIQRGAAPIPVNFKSKQPIGSAWQKQRHTAATITEAFNGSPLNLGILWGAPSKDLVDVDLDWPEAAAVASAPLPRTAVYGRAGSPGSHYLYKAASAVTRKWIAPAALVPAGHKDVVLELRAEGTQSVVPPSTHPSGELYAWEHERKPAVIAHADLLRRLNLVASGALLVPLWRQGRRHPLALALSGAMLSAGFTPDETRDFIVAVASAAGDEELHDRRLAVKSSVEAHAAGKPATGIPKIAELAGEAAVDVLKRWLGLGSALPVAWLPQDGAAAPLGGDDGSLVVSDLSRFKEQPVQWLWPNRIARGKLNVIAGEPGLSKSVLSCAITAVVTTGGRWPLDGTGCEAGDVLMLNVEDDPADTIKPRLRAAGANLERVQIIEGVRTADGKQRHMTLADVAQLDAHLAQHPNRYALLVCDPIGALMASRDTHRDSDVRTLLAPLAMLAMKYSLAVLLIGHLNKGVGTAALHRVIGSIAFVAAARMVYFLAADPDDDARLLLVPVKTNLAPMGMAGLSYTLESVDLGDGIVAPRIRWHDVPEMRSASELLSPPVDKPEQAAAEAWLQEKLAAGPVLLKIIKADAETQLEASWATIKRAAAKLGVVGAGEYSNRTWSLPEAPAEEALDQAAALAQETHTRANEPMSQSTSSSSEPEHKLIEVVGEPEHQLISSKDHERKNEPMLVADEPAPAAPRIGVAPDPATLHLCTDCGLLKNGVYCTHYKSVMPEPAKPNACVRFEPKEPATPWG